MDWKQRTDCLCTFWTRMYHPFLKFVLLVLASLVQCWIWVLLQSCHLPLIKRLIYRFGLFVVCLAVWTVATTKKFLSEEGRVVRNGADFGSHLDVSAFAAQMLATSSSVKMLKLLVLNFKCGCDTYKILTNA